MLLGAAATSQSQATDPSAAANQTSARGFERARNLGLATHQRMLVDGTTAAFVVVEQDQHRDLNADGDTDDVNGRFILSDSLLLLPGNQTCGTQMKGGARVLRRSPRNA